jgi:hypothetical protein
LYNQGWYDQQRGVQVKALTPQASDITVHYTGLLNKSGSTQVYLHTGFGDPRHWKSTEDYRMQRTPEGWKKTFNMEDNTVSFCFRDTANNWDNNNGSNWTYKIT